MQHHAWPPLPEPDEPPTLAYVETTLAASYRKEIDQEENVWRSLPFFAATLSLQLAALFQMIDKLPLLTTAAGYVSTVVLSIAGLLTLTSLSFLAASIYPQRFEYVAREPTLLAYAQDLIRDEQSPANTAQADPFSALVTLKTELARQYAEGADHNRQINKRRERWRSIAGLAALGSLAMTVFLAATTYTHYLSTHDEQEPSSAVTRIAVSTTSSITWPHQGRPPGPPGSPAAPAHADSDKGLVDPSRGAADRQRAGTRPP